MMKKKWYTLYVAAFVVMLLVPTALIPFYDALSAENRTLASAPALFGAEGVNQEFASEFDAYFSDHFALRGEMVSAYNAVTMTLLRDTLSDQVEVGSGAHLFFEKTMPAYLGTDVLSGDEIARLSRILYLQQEYVEAGGGVFAFTVAPDKNTVYPELMPGRILPRTEAKNIDLLKESLDENGVKYIDLKDTLLSNKGDIPLYYEQDTHWNDYGALLAYREIMGAVAGDAAYDRYDGIGMERFYDYGGDLHNFLFPSLPGSTLRLALDMETEYTSDRPVNLERDVEIKTSSPKNDLTAVIFRDSFGRALFPLLSSNIGRAVYSTAFPYDYSYVDEEKPDAVVVEIVERNLPELLLKAPYMAAPAREAPAAEDGTVPALADSRSVNGRLQVFGIFDPEAYRPETDRILVALEGSETYCFEAFPVLPDEFLQKAGELYGGAAENSGFVLYLPDDIAAGQYAVSLKLDHGTACTVSGPLMSLVIK